MTMLMFVNDGIINEPRFISRGEVRLAEADNMGLE